MEVLSPRELRHQSDLGNVATAVLNPGHVRVVGQERGHLRRQVDASVGRHAVQHDRHGAGVRDRLVVPREGGGVHAALEVTRRDDDGRVGARVRHRGGHVDRVGGGLAAGPREQQLLFRGARPNLNNESFAFSYARDL